MPIVFAQPSPMAPDIAAGGGAAEVATHDFAALAGLYEAANRNQLQASQAGAGLALQSSEASARNRTQADIASGQLEHANRALDLAQRPSDRDAYLAQVQAGAQQQHAQLQAWLQGQELSQAEQMQLQRNQNSIGLIQGMKERGEITGETADAMLGQVIPHINAANARHQMALAKQEEAQTKKIMDQNAQQLKMSQMDAGELAKHAQSHANTVTFPDGTTANVMVHPDGKFEIVKPENTGTRGVMAEKDWQAAYHAEESHQLKLQEASQKAYEKKLEAAQKEAATKGDKAVDWPLPPSNQGDVHEVALAAMRRRGLGGTYGEYLQNAQTIKQGMRGRPGDQPQFGNTPPTTGQPGATPTTPPPAPTPIPKEPEKQTPIQKAILAPIQDLKKNLDSPLIVPPDKKGEYAKYVDRLEELISGAGSFVALDAAGRKEYTDLMVKLDTINKPHQSVQWAPSLTPAERQRRQRMFQR